MPVRFTAYGGAGEIGGNKLLLEDGDWQVLFDFGMSFGALGTYFEEFLQRVHEEALAEASRTGEEVVLALLHELGREGGLVDVVVVLVANLAEGLDAYWEFPFHSGNRCASPAGLRTTFRRSRSDSNPRCSRVRPTSL